MVVMAQSVEQAPPRERVLSLTSQELRKLRRVARNGNEDLARRVRARVLVLAAQAYQSLEISDKLGLPVQEVQRVRALFHRGRLAALDGGMVAVPVLGTTPTTRVSDPPDAIRITLLGCERRALQRTVRAHTSEQRAALRARIVLLAAQGHNNCEVAFLLDCHVQTVRKWRARFAQERLMGLRDLARPGRPSAFEAGVRHAAIATLLGPAPEPYARWTLDQAAEALTKRGIVQAISRETLSRWLRTFDLKPHRCRYWLNSKDPAFQEKMDRIVALYINKPRYGRVICLDEKTCIPARERIGPDGPSKPGRVRRMEFEYKRHGTAHLIAAFEVHTGRVFAQCVDKNDSDAFIAFLKELRRQYPREKLYLVMDNGTTHRSQATTRFLASQPRMMPVFTPTHASWLNQVEIWFSVLSRQALRNRSFQSRQELIQTIFDYVAAHNAAAKPYRWTRTGEPLRA